jgi:hypothetical protein
MEPQPASEEACAMSWPTGEAAAPAVRLAMADPRGPLVLRAADWGRRFLTVELRHEGAHCGRLWFRFYARGEDQERIHLLVGLLPGVRTRISFDLGFLDGQRVFLRRHPGALKGVCFGRRIEPAEIDRVTVELEDTGGGQALAISAPRLGDVDRCRVDIPEPIVDELGQWRARDWPGKTSGEADLAASLTADAEAPDAGFPGAWSRFGGSRAHRFRATGFFRLERDARRWWLVDPEGCGFWSAGLDCVRPGVDSALVPGTERLFSWLPTAQGGFADCLRPAANPQRSPMVDFGVANLRRVFGDEWPWRWEELTARRLRRWRFNTVANWSDLGLPRRHALPYVMPLPPYPTTPMQLFRDLPDVFAPEFAANAKTWAEALAPTSEDPLLIGYFLANEPQWGFGSFNLAAEMLETNPGTATRRELARFVSERYAGDVAAWSKAWGRGFASFDDLVQGVHRRLDDSSPAARADLWEFSKRIVRRHAQVPSEAARAVDPNHLNLGLRYAWIASELFYEAGACFDVFSINCYGEIPDEQSVAEIVRRCGKPTMIGEFHFGALDRGLPANGLRAVASQAERAVAYRRYIERAAANPDLIGAHYFTLGDQALTGRFDGENYQIGFVDTCHRPYAELVAGATLTHERLYGLVDGSLAPFDQRAIEAPRVAY